MWLKLLFAGIITFNVIALKPCEELHKLYTGPDITVRYQGYDHQVVIQGGGGAARAEAALLLAIIKHVLRYEAQLDPTDAYFCDITKIPLSKIRKIVLTPAAILNSEGCGPEERLVDMVAGFKSSPDMDINLHLMARVHLEDCKREMSWGLLVNETAVRYCGFNVEQIISDKQNHTLTILARNETIIDNRFLNEFKRRVLVSKLPVEFKTFKDDISFRRELFHLRNSNTTYLFIDENIWLDVPDVVYLELPACLLCNKQIDHSIKAVRTGDGSIVMTYAPNIYDTFTNFSVQHNILRNILEYEANHTVTNIEEAACFWALEHKEDFTKMIRKRKEYQYQIAIFLCDGDPYNNYYVKTATTILSVLQNDIKDFNYTMKRAIRNCSDNTLLKWDLRRLNEYENVAGAVAWSWNAGVSVASNYVHYAEIPLILAGPANDTIFGQTTYASSGRFSELAKAYRYFFTQCNWNRVAIISEDNEYSEDFANQILSQGVPNIRNYHVNPENIFMNLNTLKYEDARIFIINTNCQLAKSIVSQGNSIFTPAENYVWIARDWCLSEDQSSEQVIIYSIETARRDGKSDASENVMNRLKNKTELWFGDSLISPGISYLADALLHLGHGFAAYLRNNPSYRHDIHGNGTIVEFNSAIETGNVSGVAQFLVIKNNSLYNPMIFLEKWSGNKFQTMAIWQVINKTIVDLRPPQDGQDACYALLGGKRVQDEKLCLIRSGDPFTPRCHDVATLLLGISLIIICVALFIAQKIRRKRLLAYNKSVLADILETRHKNASSLAAFLVDRGSVKLLHQIGSGCFGRVYFAELSQPGHGTLVVAAKEPHDDMTTLEENEFIREACVLARLQHHNVIKLMGVCLANGSPLMLMEHALYLDLIRFLKERKHLAIKARESFTGFNSQILPHVQDMDEVSDTNLTKWAWEAASALEYLSLHRLIHRDVRAANCLLDRRRSLKLADFGLARELDNEDPTYMSSRKAIFPVLWMAPESLEGGIFSLASDIWALGVLFLEIATLGSRPYGDWPARRVIRYVIAGGCPPLPPDSSLAMRKLLHKCWCSDPKQRITATQIRGLLMQDPNIISPAFLLPELPLLPPLENVDLDFII